jgi:hypothetical protein
MQQVDSWIPSKSRAKKELEYVKWRTKMALPLVVGQWVSLDMRSKQQGK